MLSLQPGNEGSRSSLNPIEKSFFKLGVRPNAP